MLSQPSNCKLTKVGLVNNTYMAVHLISLHGAIILYVIVQATGNTMRHLYAATSGLLYNQALSYSCYIQGPKDMPQKLSALEGFGNNNIYTMTSARQHLSDSLEKSMFSLKSIFSPFIVLQNICKFFSSQSHIA